MKVEFLEPAAIEYQDAIDFYNLQSEGLGEKFRKEIDNTIALIKNYPEGFSEYTNHTRKAIVNVFPFNIIYSILPDKILVVAVAHQHRRPSYWINR